MRLILVRLWAAPYTLLGLFLGFILRGRFAIVDGVVEIHSPAIAKWLWRLPPHAIAMTLGHVVLGASESVLWRTRTHERVHVRQFERWGPLLAPAYLLAWVYLSLRGQDGYRENPFEIEAFNADEADRADHLRR